MDPSFLLHDPDVFYQPGGRSGKGSPESRRKAPVSEMLKPGAYSIVLKKADYSNAAETVRVEAGGTKTISIVMKKPAPPPEDARTFISPTLGATFAFIPSGTFMMGSPKDEPGQHFFDSVIYQVTMSYQVTISRPFYMQTTEVTQGQWRRVMGGNPSHFGSCGDDCPVENVSWNDVQDFIGRLNRQEKTDKYRLPTEAQWEYAARAGTTTRFYWGNQDDCSKANYGNSAPDLECKGKNPGKTMRVGSFSPNAWGLYDMHGNVYEWVRDWFGYYPAGSETDPEGPSSGSNRVIRSGSWSDEAGHCRSAYRHNFALGGRDSSTGFRLLAMMKRPPQPSARETARDGRFIAYGNETVLDTQTNLIWASKDNGSDINWADAKFYCENYRGGGYTDWRMPTQDELAGLYDSSKSYEATQRSYAVNLTEFIQLSSCCPWASETRGPDAANFAVNGGYRGWLPQSGAIAYRALPVRSGKLFLKKGGRVY
jgi:formylglycine-generating enzyme required for sulfatase activity